MMMQMQMMLMMRKADDADGNDRLLKNAKIVVPLKYISIFF